MREVRVRILLMEEKTDQTFLVYIERLDTKIVVMQQSISRGCQIIMKIDTVHSKLIKYTSTKSVQQHNI